MAKILSIAIALTMVLGAFAILIPRMAAETSDVPKFVDPERYDLGPAFRNQPLDAKMLSDAMSQAPGGTAGLGNYYSVNETAPYLAPNFYTGYWNGITFKMRYNGTHCEVWVALNLNFTVGDPRNDWTRLQINDTAVEYIANQFDNVIYPKERDNFTVPANLDGSNSMLEEFFGITNEAYYFRTNSSGKVMIMIYNIRDESYYNPGYPYYIAGFFSTTTKLVYDRNIINIDCWDWNNRTTGSAPRPYVYEATVAHEYQHLLHDATDPGEELWLNEGCAMFAEFMCGYGLDANYINSYLYTQDNSLTVWGDQGDINILADYGAAALFMMYLNDQFGGTETIAALFHNQDHGGLSVTETLKTQGYTDWNFDTVFHAWTLANLIRSDNPGGGLYNYKSIDLNSPDIIPSSYGAWSYDPYDGYISHASRYGGTYTYLGNPTGVSTIGSYGVRDYHVQAGMNWRNMDPLALRFVFDGQDYVNVGWMNTNGYWWSGADNNLDVSLVGSADLTKMKEATLTFDTNYSTEESWDFGFVQVSNDSGATWVSLANEYTTNQSADGAIAEVVNNLPGLTGDSGGWVTMSFNLTAYAGQDVMFRFRYVTDPAVVYPGWFVDNVYINDTLIDNGQDVIGLSAVYPDADYTITVYAPGQWTEDGQYLLPLLSEVDVRHGPETASRSFSGMSMYDDFYIVISTNAGPVDYSFGTVNWGID